MDRAKYLTALHTRFGLSDREVVDIVERSTGRQIAATRRLISGDENEVHLVELDDGGSVYLRVAFPGAQPAKAKHEAWAMSRATDGGVPVPSVIAIQAVHTDDGERTAMVLEAANGRQLKEALPRLGREERSRAMVAVGRVLGILHSLAMPGAGVPDDQGMWTGPRTHRDHYLAKCLTACEKLDRAGFSPADVRRVVGVLENSADVPVADPPVLCHGDVSPEHVCRLRVAGCRRHRLGDVARGFRRIGTRRTLRNQYGRGLRVHPVWTWKYSSGFDVPVLDLLAQGRADNVRDRMVGGQRSDRRTSSARQRSAERAQDS